MILCYSNYIYAAPAKTAIKYKYEDVTAGTGSSYTWIDNPVITCWPSDIKDCKITVTYDDNTTVVLETVSGGKKIVVDVDEIGFENANTNEKGTGVPAGFLLLQGFTLRIIECEEYPELNGLLLDISGYNIDMNNKLTVYIPSGVY